MTVPFFDLTRQFDRLRRDIASATSRVADAQAFILGPEVEALEAELAQVVGVPRVIGVASGTDALLLALKAIGAEPGDEVIVPAFTFFATAGAVWNAGLTPVFCDVDPGTFNLTPEAIAEACTERTRAVIPVHLFGQMAPMLEITALARDRNLIVIEDAAQALGASQSHNGEVRRAGAAAPLGTFSFFPTKNLGGWGDAGAVAARDPKLGEWVRRARTHGGRKRYHHDFVGTNSRLDALQAAVLRTKLPHLTDWIEARRRIASRYSELLDDVAEVVLPHVAAGNLHTYNQFTIRVPQREALRAQLRAAGIGTAVYYPVPLHLQRCFEELGYRQGRFPIAEQLCEEVLSLPVFPELLEHEIVEVTRAIRSFFGD